MLNLANAIARGVPFVVIAPAAMETAKQPSGLLCVAKTSPYKTAKDFDGQTIAIPALKQTVDLAVREWLTARRRGSGEGAHHRGTVLRNGPGRRTRHVCRRGDLRTLALASAARRRHPVHRRSVLGDCAELSLGAWFTTKDFAAKNPAVVKKIADALTAAGKWANTHHFESAAIVSKVNKVDVDTIRATKCGPVTPRRSTERDPTATRRRIQVRLPHSADVRRRAPRYGEPVMADTKFMANQRSRVTTFSANTFKLGLFGLNLSSGRSATKVPERWSGNLGRQPAGRAARRRGGDGFPPAGRALERLRRRDQFRGRRLRVDGVGLRPARGDEAHHRLRDRPRAARPSGVRRQAVRHGRPDQPRPLRAQPRLRLERR